jgi:hypothetical protein
MIKNYIYKYINKNYKIYNNRKVFNYIRNVDNLFSLWVTIELCFINPFNGISCSH